MQERQTASYEEQTSLRDWTASFSCVSTAKGTGLPTAFSAPSFSCFKHRLRGAWSLSINSEDCAGGGSSLVSSTGACLSSRSFCFFRADRLLSLRACLAASKASRSPPRQSSSEPTLDAVPGREPPPARRAARSMRDSSCGSRDRERLRSFFLAMLRCPNRKSSCGVRRATVLARDWDRVARGPTAASRRLTAHRRF